jgi:hypothetical protein
MSKYLYIAESVKHALRHASQDMRSAALIYQHRNTHRDKLIGDEISRRAESELKRSGTQRARGKKKRS